MRYFSIHDILTVATNVNVPIPSYFEVKKPSETPDIQVMSIKDLHFQRARNGGLMRTNYCFWSEGTSLFIDYGIRNIRLVLRNLFEKPEILCTPTFMKYTTKESWYSLLNGVLLLSLLRKGHALIHAGSVCYGGRNGIIIGGPADTGKTSTVLSLVSKKYFKFMSDDATLIGRDKVYAYPGEVKTSPYTLSGALNVDSWKPRVFRCKPLALFCERFLKMDLTHLQRVPTELVAKNAPIKTIFIFGGYADKKKIEKIDSRRAARILFISSMELSTLLHPYLELYYYVFGADTFGIAKKLYEVMEKSFRRARSFLVFAPTIRKFSETIIEVLRE